MCQAALAALVSVLPLARPALADSWADQIISYDPGIGAQEGYTDPSVALGSPERYTGEGSWPGAVTPFNPAWLVTEVVSLGEGGHLTVLFDDPITNDPTHLYGTDFIIFGNGSFADGDYPNGQVAGLWEEGPFTVSVSQDGKEFFQIGGDYHDALFPALGYLDLTGPYDPNPGSVPSDFTKPVNPGYTEDTFLGKSFEEVLALYDGSGGGIPFDIGPTGLDQAYYLRIDVPVGASSPEFDAFALVPEPTTFGLLLIGGLLVPRRRRTGQRSDSPSSARTHRPDPLIIGLVNRSKASC
jgi:hypothetical protein